MRAIEKTVLDRFRMLVAERLAIYRLIVFGSRAKGQGEDESDLDVALVVDQTLDAEARMYVSECAWEAGFEYGIVVVPVVFTREEWEQGPERCSLLVQAIQSEGLPA